VIFRKRLRDEIKFDNTQKLAEQMAIDKQITLKLLS
jgi:FAD synthase